MGAVGGDRTAALHRRLTWNLMQQGMATTMRITRVVVYILIGSSVSAWCSGGGRRSLAGKHVDLAAWGHGRLPHRVNLFGLFPGLLPRLFEIAFIIIPLLAPSPRNWAST